MNAKTTVVLALLVLGGGVLMFLEAPWKDAPRAGEAAATTNQTDGPGTILDDAPDSQDVYRVEIRVGEKTPVVCERKDDDWRITAPIECSAESYIPRQIVNQCLRLRYVRRFSPGDESMPTEAMAGLDRPISTITLHVRDRDEPLVFRFGRQAPLSSNHYVSLPGDQHIYVVSENPRTTFARTLEDIRTKKIFDFATNQAVAVSVAGRHSYELVRTDDLWMIERPVRTRAERAKASTLVSAVSNLRAVEFIDDLAADLSPYGLDRPTWTIKLSVEKEITPPADQDAATPPDEAPAESETEESPDETPQPIIERTEYTLLLGGPAGQNRYAKLSEHDWVFTIPETALKSMAPELTDLMARKLFDFDKGDVEKITLHVAGETETLVKEASTWTRSDGRSVEPIAVEELLNAMRDLTAINFQQDPPLVDSGVDEPRATVELTVKGRPEPVRALVGNPTASAKMVYLRSGNNPTIALLRAESVGTLLTPPIGYRDRQILDFTRNDAYRIEIVRNEETFVLDKSDEGIWRMSQPTEALADAASVSNILADLNNLRAVTVVAADSGSDYGLDKPWVRATVSVETRAQAPPIAEPQEPGDDASTQPSSQPAPTERQVQSHTVLMSASTNGKIYARRHDGELVFEVDHRIMNNLVAELHDRTALPIDDPETITKLQLAKQAKTLTLERIGDKWIADVDPALPIDASKVAAALRQLKAIQTGKFISYQADHPGDYGLDQPAVTVIVTDENGNTVELAVSGDGPRSDPDNSRYATRIGSGKVFLLKLNDVGMLNKSLADFEKAD